MNVQLFTWSQTPILPWVNDLSKQTHIAFSNLPNYIYPVTNAVFPVMSGLQWAQKSCSSTTQETLPVDLLAKSSMPQKCCLLWLDLCAASQISNSQNCTIVLSLCISSFEPLNSLIAPSSLPLERLFSQTSIPHIFHPKSYSFPIGLPANMSSAFSSC